MTKLQEALLNPIWLNHKRNESIYTMDGLPDKWILVYYPIFKNGKTNELYKEPRALMQNIDKTGVWTKEVPLRYLNNKKD
jgi:hypothetical protein